MGGGIVGLATAWQLLRQYPALQLAVVEKEDTLAAHQSSRNSGVLHSGIYYKPGSLRALNCIKGYKLMTTFCEEHKVPYDVCGKVIVAVDEQERKHLDRILERGRQNGLQGLRKISGAEIREIEPHVQAVEGIWVPQAGITDYGTVARTYARLIETAGGTIVTRTAIQQYQERPEAVIVSSRHWEASAALVINCGGLYSDQLARLSGEVPNVQILPFRGEYYELKPERQYLVRNLIYPVPNPNFPFLGVHFTRMIQGGIEAGPNAVLAFRQEGYSRWDFHAGEFFHTIGYPGFQRLARRYWKDGWAELRRSYQKKLFVQALQRLIPEIRAADLTPARAGVRAMACTPDGNLHDDFLILEKQRVINVCNAPSPAATASLAIGETIAARAARQLNLS